MGCCVSAKKTKVTLEASSSQITTTSPGKKTQEVPVVAALLRELTDDFEQKSSSEASLVIQEAPAKPRSQSPALETRPVGVDLTNQVKLPEVKPVEVSGFDKERYKTANKGVLPSIFSLPLSIQEQFDELDVRNIGKDPSTKPASSLVLLSQQVPHRKEGSMEQYLAARTIIYS